ncbi:MAG TPA: hypothetical protein VI643_02915, partial [Planctomycetota bacterium]|nr:hypothetical protein [Planctomycetota bacterium]
RGVVRALGADPDAFRRILATSLKIDFRTARSSRGGRGSPFLSVLITYALLGALMGWLVTAQRLPALQHAAVIFALSMINTLMAVLLDFHVAILGPDDAEVIGTRPVSSRTYFLARLCNFLFYVGALGSAIHLGPALSEAAAGRPALAAGLFGAGLLSGYFCAGVVVLFYSVVIRLSDLERLKDLLVYAQIGMTVLLIGAYQLLGRADRLAQVDLESAAWGSTPPVWFASLAAWVAGEGDSWLAAGAVAAAAAAILAPLPLMSFRYAEYLNSLRVVRRRARADAPAGPRGVGVRIWSRLLLTSGERRFFDFCSRQALRDRAVKMRAIPMALFPIIFLAWGLARGGLDNPFEPGPAGDFGSTIVPFFILLGAVNLVFVMQSSEHHSASWILRAAPLMRPADAVLGWHKTVMYGLAAPLFALFAVVTAIAWKAPAEAMLNAALLFVLADAAVSISMIALVRDFPFSRAVTRGEGLRVIGVYFILMAVLGGAFAIQAAVYRTPDALPIFALGLVGASLGLRTLSAFVVGRRLMRSGLMP